MKMINMVAIGLDFVIEAENYKDIPLFPPLQSSLWFSSSYIIGNFFLLDGKLKKIQLLVDRNIHEC